MAKGVSISAEFEDGIGAALRQALAHAEHPFDLLSATGGALVASTHTRFDGGRGPSGIPWPPSGRTKAAAVPKKRARKNKMGPIHGGKTLVDTGALRDSIRFEVGPDSVTVGTDGANRSAKYAATHQFGATIKAKPGKKLVFTAPDGSLVFTDSVTIPARPFIGFDAGDRVTVEDIWSKAIGDALRGSVA